LPQDFTPYKSRRACDEDFHPDFKCPRCGNKRFLQRSRDAVRASSAKLKT
jgi:DNA-directed RNA polymerase subunit RPC12/RpoP